MDDGIIEDCEFSSFLASTEGHQCIHHNAGDESGRRGNRLIVRKNKFHGLYGTSTQVCDFTGNDNFAFENNCVWNMNGATGVGVYQDNSKSPPLSGRYGSICNNTINMGAYSSPGIILGNLGGTTDGSQDCVIFNNIILNSTGTNIVAYRPADGHTIDAGSNKGFAYSTRNTLFVSPDSGNFHLKEGTTPINSGLVSLTDDNAGTKYAPTADADGIERVGAVDIGAYEYVPPGSISLSCGDLSNTCAWNETATATVTITRTNFTGNVSFSLVNPPTGITAAFSPSPTTGNTSTMTVSVGSAAATGTHTLTILGSGTVSDTTTASIVVVPKFRPVMGRGRK